MPFVFDDSESSDTLQGVASIERMMGVLSEQSMQSALGGVKVRANLYLDITPLLTGTEAVEVINVVSTVARLCDADISEVNIVLCSETRQTELKDGESCNSDNYFAR